MKIKYCRIQFSNGKFKTIKGCKSLTFDESDRSCIRVNCTDGRIYIFNWNLIQEFKLWEEEENEKPKRSRKKVSTKATGDTGAGCGDQTSPNEASGTPGDDD